MRRLSKPAATVYSGMLLAALSIGCNGNPDSLPGVTVVPSIASVPEPLPSNLVDTSIVKVVKTEKGFALHRGGKPYRINGAGGKGSLKMLAASGANSNRHWGVGDDTKARLDEAHAQGVSVALGIWLEHASEKFSYSEFDDVSGQLDKVIEAVRKYKDHPAVLVWGVGNEMENSGGGRGDNPAIWQHVGYLASLIKKEDPHHPVMTVIAEVGGRKVKAINKFCPDVDIIGINSYGGGPTVGERYRQTGGTKPFIITEYGPIGTWEVSKNKIGAIEEPTSTDKTKFYRRSFEALQDDPLCFGSYAFLWGEKQEATATWFGMLTPDGKKTAAVDLMQELWSGKKPDNLCPEIKPLTLEGSNSVAGEAVVNVKLQASDPEGDSLNVSWKLMQEADSYITGGFKQERPPSFDKAMTSGSNDSATFKLPKQPGLYRIYATVDDGNNGVAIANVPVRVEAPEEKVDLSKVAKGELPYDLYAEPSDAPVYVPSGFMGATRAIKVDPNSKEKPHQGGHCIECTYDLTGEWGGVVWQSPENDWGDKAGGLNLTGCKRLSFWAKGAQGGEEMTFGVGLIDRAKPFFDTAKEELKVTLTKDWKEYEIDLSEADCGRIKSGFFWSLAGQGKKLKFYLDDIRYE